MMLKVWRRFMMTALPTLFAACSRLMRWRSTRTCFSSAERSCNNSENESCISGSSSTRGLINSRMAVRSAFLAQPGKARCLRLRALRQFADVLGPLLHRLKQTPETFRERHITNAATEPARLFEIGLGETADRTLL